MKPTFILILIATLVLLTGCADNAAYTVLDPNVHVYGFWGGLWHGMIVTFDLIAMIFSDNVSVYAPSNNGGWYAFGFWLGLSGILSGTGKALSR